MTGKELIKWIQDNNIENCEVRIQYRDSGGDYDGTDEPYMILDSSQSEPIIIL